MKYGRIITTREEKLYLISLLSNKKLATEKSHTKLAEELNQAEIRLPEEIPSDVVRFYTVVDIQTPMGLFDNLQLVPTTNGKESKKISIITPMGAAIYGYAEGDEVTWNFPGGKKTIKILRVSTPNIKQEQVVNG